MTQAQTPEILQIINNFIVNIMLIVNTFWKIILVFLLILFVIWLFFEIARGARDAIRREN